MSPGPAKQFDREQALAKALRLFWRRGYDAVGVSELLAEMGIGRQSMYDTFGTKRELFVAALQSYMSEQVEAVEGLLTAPGPPLENLGVAFDHWKQLLDQGDGCFAGNTFSELGPRDDEVAAVLKTGMKKVVAAFQGALERAVAEGDLRADTDVVGLAHLISIAGQGAAAVSQLSGGAGLAYVAWAHLENVIESYRLVPPGDRAGGTTGVFAGGEDVNC